MYVTYISSKVDTMCMLHISVVGGYHVYVTYISSKVDTMCMLHISVVRIPCVCYIYQE